MTQIVEAAATTTSTARLYRIAGWGAIVAAIGYLTQPIIVFIIDPIASAPFDPEDPAAWYRDPADVLAQWYLGAEQFLQFAIVGIGVLALVVATGILIRSRLTTSGQFGVWPQVAFIAGAISVVGWLSIAGASLGAYSLPAFSITDFTGVDVETRKLAYHAASVGSMGAMLGTILLPTAIWLAGVATSARRAGVVPTTLAVICGIAALVLLANLLFMNLTNHVPASALLLIVVWLALGVYFLVRARREGIAAQ